MASPAASAAAGAARSFASVVAQPPDPQPVTLADTTRARDASSSASSSVAHYQALRRVGPGPGSASGSDDTSMDTSPEVLRLTAKITQLEAWGAWKDQRITQLEEWGHGLIDMHAASIGDLRDDNQRLRTEVAILRASLPEAHPALQPAFTFSGVTQVPLLSPTPAAATPAAAAAAPAAPASSQAQAQPSAQSSPAPTATPKAAAAATPRQKAVPASSTQQPQPATTSIPAPAATPKAAAAAKQRPSARRPPAWMGRDMDIRRRFNVIIRPGSVQGTPREQVKHVLGRMQLAATDYTIVDVLRAGADSVYFEVATLEQAQTLVRHRRHLKGSAFVLHEVLSPEERILHARLMPQFLAARAKGVPAQFCRARLFIAGVAVQP